MQTRDVAIAQAIINTARRVERQGCASKQSRNILLTPTEDHQRNKRVINGPRDGAINIFSKPVIENKARAHW